MAIFESGAYQVKASAAPKVKEAIREFLDYLRENEPGTQMYLAWQQQDDPTRFIHLFIFADAAARDRHGESEAVKRFESVYTPELVSSGVTFTEYELVAGKLTQQAIEAVHSHDQPGRAG